MADSRISQRITAIFEEEIEKLQLQVKELVNKNQKTLTENLRLESENTALKNELRQSKSSSNPITVQVQRQTTQAATSDDYNLLFQNHQQLKAKYNSLVLDYKQQTQRLKTLEVNFKRSSQTGPKLATPVAPLPAPIQVPLDNPADKARIAELEKELADAYEVIDELEFEIEGIGMLESDNERLQSEVQQLKEELQQLTATGQATGQMSGLSLTGGGEGSRANKIWSDPARRSHLLQKLQVMHTKHDEFFERIKQELGSIEDA